MFGQLVTGQVWLLSQTKIQPFVFYLFFWILRLLYLPNISWHKVFSKDLQGRAHQLADDYYAIGAEINHFSELMKCTDIPQIVSMYRRLSDLIIRNGDFTLQSGELMNQQLAGWFKYQRQEARSYQEAHWLRAESVARFNAQKTDLNKRKEKIFKRKDVTEWGCSSETLREAMDSLDDAERAFTYMLPNVSQLYSQS